MSDTLTMNLDQITIDSNVRHELRLDDAFVASIKEHGVLQPVIVNNGVLITGHRRYAGAELAGRTEVPVVLMDIAPEDVRAIQLVENVHRMDLTPLELAQAVWDMKVDDDFTQPMIEDATGMSKTVISELQKIGKRVASNGGVTDEQLAIANQMTIEGLIDLASLDDDLPAGDVLRIFGEQEEGWDHSIRSAAADVRIEQRVVAFMDDIKPQLEEWSIDGVEVTYDTPNLTDEEDQWGHKKKDRKYKVLGGHDAKIDIAKHMSLDCHITEVDIPTSGYSEPRVVHWCKDFKVHETKGTSKLKHKDAKRKTETRAANSELAKEQREAKASRRIKAASWLAGNPSKTKLTSAAMGNLANEKHYDDAKRFLVILGFDSEKPKELTGMDGSNWFAQRWTQYLDDTCGDDQELRNLMQARLVLASRYVEQAYGNLGSAGKELIEPTDG